MCVCPGQICSAACRRFCETLHLSLASSLAPNKAKTLSRKRKSRAGGGWGGGRGCGSPSVPSKQGAALRVFGAEPAASDTGRLVRP